MRMSNYFVDNYDVTGQIFCIRQTFEKQQVYNGAVHHLFIDFKKAYASVNSDIICNNIHISFE
jgi:hypothetical protein